MRMTRPIFLVLILLIGLPVKAEPRIHRIASFQAVSRFFSEHNLFQLVQEVAGRTLRRFRGVSDLVSFPENYGRPENPAPPPTPVDPAELALVNSINQ